MEKDKNKHKNYEQERKKKKKPNGKIEKMVNLLLIFSTAYFAIAPLWTFLL